MTPFIVASILTQPWIKIENQLKKMNFKDMNFFYIYKQVKFQVTTYTLLHFQEGIKKTKKKYKFHSESHFDTILMG